MFYDPWSGEYNSEIDYRQHATSIICDCSKLAVKKLAIKLKILDPEILDELVCDTYERSIYRIHEWDHAYSIYNHCWKMLHSLYPEVLRKYNAGRMVHMDDFSNVMRAAEYASAKPKTEEEEIEADIEMAREWGISHAYRSYSDYIKEAKARVIRKLAEKRGLTRKEGTNA